MGLRLHSSWAAQPVQIGKHVGLILLLPMIVSEPQSKSGSPKTTGKTSLLGGEGCCLLETWSCPH